MRLDSPTDVLEHLVRRAEGEYLEMPGLRLTREQAQRLWALDRATCIAVLDALIGRKFLVCDGDERYKRSHESAA